MRMSSLWILVLMILCTLASNARDIFEAPPRMFESRYRSSSLDDACTISQGGSVMWIDYGFEVDDELLFWIDPTDCNSSPSYPFLVEEIAISGADGSLLQGSGAGVGTLTYQITVYCATNGCNEPCEGPGDLIWESTDIILECNDEGFQTFETTPNFCVNGPFFIGMKYIDWVSASPSVPGPLWDGNSQPLCRQYVCYSFAQECFDTETDLGYGTGIISVSGNTSDGCTPVSCLATGACCDHVSGVCVDNVSVCECASASEEFFPGESCMSIQTQCTVCPPLPAPNDLVIETIGPDVELSWSTIPSTGEFCPEPEVYLVFFEEEQSEDPDFLAFTTNTSYVHAGVVQFSPQMFYHVEGYRGLIGALAELPESKGFTRRSEVLEILGIISQEASR